MTYEEPNTVRARTTIEYERECFVTVQCSGGSVTLAFDDVNTGKLAVSAGSEYALAIANAIIRSVKESKKTYYEDLAG